jgi:hypothetical protein
MRRTPGGRAIYGTAYDRSGHVVRLQGAACADPGGPWARLLVVDRWGELHGTAVMSRTQAGELAAALLAFVGGVD